MRRTAVFFALAVCCFILTVISTRSANAASFRIGDNVSSVSVTSSRKRDALREANAKIESGATPEEVKYFADSSKYRTLDDGYYTITVENGMSFNVDADGADTDYEGVRITTWQKTEDVTQRFRIIMSEDGSYVLYAACSRGGYSRAVGYDSERGSVALYAVDSPYFATFYLRDTGLGDGTYYIVPSTDEKKHLSCRTDSINGDAVFLCDGADGDGCICKWKFETWGSALAAYGEKAMYPGDNLLITQMPFDTFSHQLQNAIDIQVKGNESVAAPFTCRVVAINETCGNVVWIESMQEVLYADGTYDYMTCLFMHDNDISDIYVGQIILQGEYFYEMGTAGYAVGSHVHISCYRGKYSPSMKINNDGEDGVLPQNAFFLPKGIKIYDSYGLAWIYDG